MTFLLGIGFQSMYFPWVLIGFRILLGGFPLAEICGAIIGHLYYFLAEIYPATHNGARILTTPQFLKDLFPRVYQSSSRYSLSSSSSRSPSRRWWFELGKRVPTLIEF
jgi:hypothetical protein